MPGSAGRPLPAGPFASVRTLPSVSSRQGVADGQVLEAADERGGHPLRLPRELDGFQARQELGGQVVVKAQVQVGGRGKAGGIKLAENADEVRTHAGNILD